MCLPVISAVGVRHGSVGLVADQPVEALVCEEADLLPVRAHHIVAVCVEVSQQHDVLQRDCNGLTTPTPISYITTIIVLCTQPILSDATKLLIFCVAVFVELKKSVHVGVPAGADISHHIIQSVHFLHRRVRRGVLGDQNKVLHS